MSETLCRNKFELFKALAVLCYIPADSSDKALMSKLILHDYYNLVKEGKMEEIQVPKFDEETKSEFRQLMTNTSELLMQGGGLPLKENKDGSMDIDEEELLKRFEEE